MSESWLRTLYVEGWKQYSHEDNIGQTRNNLFLGVQSALILILTVVTGSLIKMGPMQIGLHQFWVRLLVLGIIVIILAVLSIRLASCWENVTRSGQAYLNLRWIAIKLIEEQASLHTINLAGMEHAWRKFSKNSPDNEYCFGNNEYCFGNSESPQYCLPPLGKVDGWQAILNVSKIVKRLWYFILSVGILLVAGTIFRYFLLLIN